MAENSPTDENLAGVLEAELPTDRFWLFLHHEWLWH
jgi:hypothetical protein